MSLGHVSMSNVKCTGKEYDLRDCHFNSLYEVNCSHAVVLECGRYMNKYNITYFEKLLYQLSREIVYFLWNLRSLQFCFIRLMLISLMLYFVFGCKSLLAYLRVSSVPKNDKMTSPVLTFLFQINTKKNTCNVIYLFDYTKSMNSCSCHQQGMPFA